MKVKKLDTVFSRYVRLLAGGYCKKCGRYVGYSNLDNAHFFSRIRHTVRWDTRNTVALCNVKPNSCHYWIDVNPIAKTSFFVSILGVEQTEELERLANMTTKAHPIDKEALYKEYTEKISKLEEI